MPMRHDFSENLMSLQSHILLEEAKHPSASGDFTWIVSAISLAAKSIANHVRRARLSGAIGKFGDTNVQGEEQQKLDVIADEVMFRHLGKQPGVAALASEESEGAVAGSAGSASERRYAVMFDPLDGSSNIDVCGGIGTIFSIVRHEPDAAKPEDSLLQPGVRQ
ncbi:MAG: class 1 fructose-bisphosphatase, partial [Planctomycetota bacterium]